MGWQPKSPNRGGTLGQQRWPDRLRLAGSEAGREVVLGRLSNAAHPFGESGQGGSHWKNEVHGDVLSAGGGMAWRGQSAVVGGRLLSRDAVWCPRGAQDGED
jgi:hypothetical protein